MSVSVINRPIGIILGDCLAATIDEDYAGKATVNTATPHQLSDGDYVYVRSNIENYNGFWTIDVIDGFHFFLLQYPGGPEVAFIVNADITYCPQESTHGWNAAHLPIVYELESNSFPTNSVSTARTVSSYSDDNGYVNLNLSGSLGTFEELSFIKITGTAELDGVYQILTKLSTSDVTINLAYSSAYSFASGTAKLYFSNYHILIEVWAGITAGHTWESLKPYEKAATLKLIPAADNRVKFSINEILKSYINTVNNTLLASLPNNTDFWCNFYIKYAEAYDVSNGYTITTHEDAFTSDLSSFEGSAANASLEFKNQYSGQLSEYLMNHATAKFLTLFTIPVLFGCSEDNPECYQDVSFVNVYPDAVLSLKKVFYLENAEQTTETQSIENTGEGVYRVPLAANCSYDRVDVTLMGQVNPADYTTFAQLSGGGTWTYIGGTYPLEYINPSGVPNTGRKVYLSFRAPAGTYLVTGTHNNVSDSQGSINAFFLDEDFNVISTGAPSLINIGSSFGGVGGGVMTSSKEIFYVAFAISYVSGTAPIETDFNFDVYDVDVNQPNVPLGETKTFKIDCGCSKSEIRLSWLNNLGGFDSWNLTAFKEHIIEVKGTGETKQNILSNWPKSYGSDATTIRKQTYRDTGKQFLVRSQHVTLDELQAIAFIKSSVLVQEVNSRSDRRTVLVDEDSFTEFKEDDKLYTISFIISYTNDIPSQRT